MIVVADSGPLHYLVLLEQTALLRRLYGEVWIPEPVANELRAGNAPQRVSEWVSIPPSWVTVVAVTDEDIDSVSDALDLGERAAIFLAEKIRADLLLIDESAGRAEAARRSIRVTGTLGVLRTAAEQGLVDVNDVLVRLRATNFYVEEEFLRKVFAKWVQ